MIVDTPARPGDVGASHRDSPVGVFDGGIGSFDLVRRLRAAFPRQDIIYLADRARFPYGAQDEDELLVSIVRAIRALIEMGAASIVLASNAPSVTVLDRVGPLFDVPVLGVKPPVRDALDALPDDAVLAIAGAGVLVESRALWRHIVDEAGAGADRVVAVNADPLISLVEEGAFLDETRVREPVLRFVSDLRARHQRVAGLTLSSTHLPWLAPAFAALAPELRLFDPADRVVAAFAEFATTGTGRLLSVATQSAAHPIDEFRATIDALGLDLSPILIDIDGVPL